MTSGVSTGVEMPASPRRRKETQVEDLAVIFSRWDGYFVDIHLKARRDCSVVSCTLVTKAVLNAQGTDRYRAVIPVTLLARAAPERV
jgi:hypothetical protein